jgi:hypothetical protein
LLQLQSLTLSPLLITDKAALNSLRGHNSLKSIRTPTDKEGQTFVEFWRRLDAGDYVESNH